MCDTAYLIFLWTPILCFTNVSMVGGIGVGLTTPPSKKTYCYESLAKQKAGYIKWCRKMERVGGRWEKMEGHCSTGQSPQWAVVPTEEKEEKINFI